MSGHFLSLGPRANTSQISWVIGPVDSLFSGTYSSGAICLLETKGRLPQRILGAVLVSLTGTGCVSEVELACEELSGQSPAIEVGTGIETFEAIENTTLYEQGPQGGWHVYASIRSAGLYGGVIGSFDESAPRLSYQLASADGTLTGGFAEQPRPMQDLGSGRYEIVGEFAVLKIDDPSLAEGVEVTITAKVEDACGRQAEASAMTTLSESAL